ncbi:MAG: Maf family protein [Treponema sp.]|nr:Maf family protein [Treponema sp.]
MEPIILASASLRRQEYFKLLALPFSIMPARIDETPPAVVNPIEFTADLAVRKVKKVIETMSSRLPYWICGADTVVTLNGEVFGKPLNRDEAKSTLTRLSGREHEVVTSMALYNRRKDKIDCRSVSCFVDFAPFSDEEIEWYLNTSEWQGVAGAYRIQGIAACFINSIKGCPSTVVGLPLREFYVMLRDNGYPYGG